MFDVQFQPKHSIRGAVDSLVNAFGAGRIPNPMTDKVYYNIKTMQAVSLA